MQLLSLPTELAARLARALGAIAGRRRVAAAVCVRGEGRRLEFALVTTRDGERWTFPKGHREPGETLAAAAAREAAEEGGLIGRVDRQRLLAYRYPARGGRDVLVTAHLLHVSEVGPPAEDFRRLVWCDGAGARRRLAEGREPFYAAELGRVLDAAVRACDASRAHRRAAGPDR